MKSPPGQLLLGALLLGALIPMMALCCRRAGTRRGRVPARRVVSPQASAQVSKVRLLSEHQQSVGPKQHMAAPLASLRIPSQPGLGSDLAAASTRATKNSPLMSMLDQLDDDILEAALDKRRRLRGQTVADARAGSRRVTGAGLAGRVVNGVQQPFGRSMPPPGYHDGHSLGTYHDQLAGLTQRDYFQPAPYATAPSASDRYQHNQYVRRVPGHYQSAG